METQNVSAQLFVKNLPSEDIVFGCKPDMDSFNLTTCVDPVQSDSQIENAFQKQLDLTEYYKSPGVFDAMKKMYHDQTMEAEASQSTPEQTEPVEAPKIINSKESFGSVDSWWSSLTTFQKIMFCVICFLVLSGGLKLAGII